MNSESTMEKVENNATDGQQPAERTRSGRYYRPNVDILERRDELLLLADMPGAAPGEIDVRFEGGELAILGLVSPRDESSANYLLGEYGVGDFYRTFRVSENIDASKIHAEYSDGVLRVHLPKVEAVKPRKIAVKTN